MAELLTPATLSVISALLSITGASMSGFRWSKDIMTGKNTDLNSRQSILLMERTKSVGDTLKVVHPEILTRPIGQRIIQTLIDSMGWALRYNKKWKLKKILKFEKYRAIFRTYHRALSRDLADLSHMLNIYILANHSGWPDHLPEEFGLDERQLAGLINSEPDRRVVRMVKPGKKVKLHRDEIALAACSPSAPSSGESELI